MSAEERYAFLEGRTSKELCNAYNHALIKPRTEQDVEKILVARGVRTCDGHSKRRDLPTVPAVQQSAEQPLPESKHPSEELPRQTSPRLEEPSRPSGEEGLRAKTETGRPTDVGAARWEAEMAKRGLAQRKKEEQQQQRAETETERPTGAPSQQAAPLCSSNVPCEEATDLAKDQRRRACVVIGLAFLRYELGEKETPLLGPAPLYRRLPRETKQLITLDDFTTIRRAVQEQLSLDGLALALMGQVTREVAVPPILGQQMIAAKSERPGEMLRNWAAICGISRPTR